MMAELVNNLEQVLAMAEMPITKHTSSNLPSILTSSRNGTLPLERMLLVRVKTIPFKAT